MEWGRAMQMTLTISDRLGAALKAKAAAEFGMEAPEYLKNVLFAAAQSPEGVVLKLELAPLPKGEVPLFDAVGVTLDSPEPARAVVKPVSGAGSPPPEQ